MNNSENQKSLNNNYHPLTIIRLWPDQYVNPDSWQHTLKLLKEYHAAIDEIWLCTAVNYPEIKIHTQQAHAATQVAEMARTAGFMVGLQIANTIGHGDRPMYDNQGINFRVLVGHDGQQATTCFCPRCPELQNYFKQVISLHAEWQPRSVWIDDDLRMNHHAPVDYGCFCPHCLDAFLKYSNTTWTRETLVKELHNPDNGKLRLKWTQFNEESLSLLAGAIAETVHAKAPECIMAIQTCGTDFTLYNGYNNKNAFNTMHDITNLPVGNRPGVGVYDDHAPRAMINKAFAQGRAAAIQPDCVSITAAEIENYPHISMGKTPKGTATESSLNLALGCNSLSFAIICNNYEPVDFYKTILSRITEYYPFWTEFLNATGNTFPGGLHIALSEQHVTRQIKPNEELFAWSKIDLAGIYQMSAIGLPLTPDPRGAQATLLHAETVAGFTDTEIETILSGGVIMDGLAALQIQERGLGSLLGVTAAPFPRNDCVEQFSDDSINDGLENRVWRWTVLGNNQNDVALTANGPIREITYFKDPAGKHAATGTALIENSLGGRIAIFGRYPWTTTINSALRMQMLRIADWVCNRQLPAILETAAQVIVIPRVDNNGQLKAVFLLNATIDTTLPLTLILRGCNPSAIKWFQPETDEQTLNVIQQENDIKVIVPPLPPWSEGFLVPLCR